MVLHPLMLRLARLSSSATPDGFAWWLGDVCEQGTSQSSHHSWMWHQAPMVPTRHCSSAYFHTFALPILSCSLQGCQDEHHITKSEPDPIVFLLSLHLLTNSYSYFTYTYLCFVLCENETIHSAMFLHLWGKAYVLLTARVQTSGTEHAHPILFGCSTSG